MIICLTLLRSPWREYYELNVSVFLARPKARRDCRRRSRIGASHATILPGRPAAPEAFARRRRSNQARTVLVTRFVRSMYFFIEQTNYYQ